MDVEAVTTEVLAIAMTAIFFFNIFIDSPFGILGKIGAFLAFFILAIYLIRGVLREANQRAELKDFNDNLADKVAKQTVEIRASYEAERQARQDLEKLNDAKNQFVVMTQHNLRAPISNINQTISEITEAVERGEPSAVNHNQLKSAAASGKRLTNLVDDFLNISTLKPGANILDIDTTSLRDQMRYIIEESRRILEEGQIRVVWPDRETAWPKIPVDAAKMREVLAIIFENAIRYNEPGGSIEINTSTNDDTFEILVRNTGIGISPEDAGRIGASIFYRSEWARKRYPVGMGVGLSVVRAIIEAHKGTFTISSEGIGTGAIAKVTLPLRFSIRETFTPTSP